MHDYLIRTVADHGWPAFRRDRMADVLQPRGWSCVRVPGFGDFRVRSEGAEVSFSGEEVGWHVVVEGDLTGADAWIEQVTRQIAVAAGEECEWLGLS